MCMVRNGFIVCLGLFLAYAYFKGITARLERSRNDIAVASSDFESPTDAGNYLRMVHKILGGEVATDDVNNSVSYRTVTFSTIFSPVFWWYGQNRKAIDICRWIISAMSLLLVLNVIYLTWLIFARGSLRWFKSGLAGLLILYNQEFCYWSTEFMPDIPSLLFALWTLTAVFHLSQQNRVRVISALLVGFFVGLTVTMKFDYFYTLLGTIALVTLGSWMFDFGNRIKVTNLRWFNLITGFRELVWVKHTSYRNICWVLVGASIFLGGYVCRNWYHVGSPFLTSKDAVNLWIGNNPHATGGYMWLPEWGDGIGIVDEPAMRHLFYNKVFEYIRAQPDHFIRGLAAKATIYDTVTKSSLITLPNKWPDKLVLPQILYGSAYLGIILTFFVPSGGIWARSFLRFLGSTVLLLQTAVIILVFVSNRFILTNIALIAILGPGTLIELFEWIFQRMLMLINRTLASLRSQQSSEVHVLQHDNVIPCDK